MFWRHNFLDLRVLSEFLDFLEHLLGNLHGGVVSVDDGVDGGQASQLVVHHLMIFGFFSEYYLVKIFR